MTLVEAVPVITWAATGILRLIAPKIPKRARAPVAIAIGTVAGLALAPESSQPFYETLVSSVTMGAAAVGAHEGIESITGKRKRKGA